MASLAAYLLLNLSTPVQVLDAPEHRNRQEHRGLPGPETRYRRFTRGRFRLAWYTDEESLARDRASDGMFPLMTNDRTLTLRDVLEAYPRPARDPRTSL